MSLTFEEQVKQRFASEQEESELLFEKQVKQRFASQQEKLKRGQAELAHARSELERSPLPGMKAYGVAAGAPIVSLLARVGGASEYADAMNRHAIAIEQAQREREKGGIVPDILQRGARGAGASLTSMAGGGVIAGPYGAIALAAGQETNRAITEGKSAGKKGIQLASYAAAKGIWEGLPAAAMQRVGLGGVEKIFSKEATAKAVSVGLRQGVKKFGAMAVEELIEENITEVVSLAIDDFSKTDPGAFTLGNITETVAETTTQTLIAVAFGGGPGVARSIEAGKVKKITEEMTTLTREGKTPTRGDWKRWGLTSELGKSRRQRRTFIQEVVKRNETPAVEPGVEPPIQVEEMPAEAPPITPEGVEPPVGPSDSSWA